MTETEAALRMAELTTAAAGNPAMVDIDPPRTVGAMPDSGQQRNVAKDGW